MRCATSVNRFALDHVPSSLLLPRRLLCAGLTLSLLLSPLGCRPNQTTEVGRTVNPRGSHTEDPSATSTSSQVVSIETVQQAARQKDWDGAKRLIESLLIVTPEDPSVLELASEIAIARRESALGAELLERAVDCTPSPSVELMDKSARLWMNQGEPFSALRLLEKLNAVHPENVKARADLAGLQASLGLELRAAVHLQYLVQHQHAGINELIVLTDLTRPQTDTSICEFALKHRPDDLRPNYALARATAYQGDWAKAKKLLEPVCRQQPEFIEASAYLGRALVELDDSPGIKAWAASRPVGIEAHPQYWLAAGVWAERQQAFDVAAHSYWQAVAINENDGEALTRLGTCLAELGRIDDSQRASARAGQITAMRDDVETLFSWRNHSQRAAVQIALSMQRLGRTWEAATWAKIAVLMTQDPDPNAALVFSNIRQQMTGKTPWQVADSIVTHAIDITDLPEIDWGVALQTQRRLLAAATSSLIQFTDEAARRGLNHTCKINKPPGEEAGLWIYQSGAGGVAVIDIDLNGWPDFYLTSSDGTPKQRDSAPNRLFRNLDGHFVDVTIHSGVGDQGFAQGVAAGDYDSDGFPDLFVGNFGENQLLRNNGDGTFTDVTDAIGLQGDDWTTSVAIADLDGDSIADLIEVNYIDGDDVMTQQCFSDAVSTHRSCGPLVFPAAADGVWQGRGDGTFIDVRETWINDTLPGRGLGLILGMLDDQAGVDVYVANDMSANQFWSQQTDRRQSDAPESSVGVQPRFVEHAAVRGLAFNERSLSQASMGIAADDCDSDGDLDFYVTHFTDDYNTLYQQIGPGIWADRTAALALATSTKAMLAYGTQWLDVDNDGVLELAVANGNVDDFTHSGHAYRMPMQLFGRGTSGQYIDQSHSELGPYFQSQRLGRALVTVDANRDQRVDMLVTHLFDPVSLLINTSPLPHNGGRAMTMRLVGTDSHRDATGAIVRIEYGENSQVHQLLAGNGYQCSTERCLRFGIGAINFIDRIEVRWPSGRVSNVLSSTQRKLDASRDYLWIEGETEPRVYDFRD